LAVCRKLAELYDLASPLEAYRGDVLCLWLRLIQD
jgi:hypothetical protein